MSLKIEHVNNRIAHEPPARKYTVYIQALVYEIESALKGILTNYFRFLSVAQ